jgi:RNA polymerase sigma factor (sigma-70 family)
MKSSGMDARGRDLRTLFSVGAIGGLSDGQLLGRFVEQREAAAFEVIVHRHSPMVWGVCRRILRDRHDAEDAFQVTFLVLARKAASVLPREKLGNWLYGVAYQTARKARAMRDKRRGRESQGPGMPEQMAVPDVLRDALTEALDRELSRLPEKYRIPVILCDLEGKTHKEAARQLGWPVGTVSSRLSRARTLLAIRLSRPGMMLTVGSLAFLLARDAEPASVPNTLVGSTALAARLITSGGAMKAGVVSTQVAALMGEVLKMILLSKLKVAVIVLLGCFVVAAGGTGFAYRAVGSMQHDSKKQPSPSEGVSGKTAGPIRSWAEYHTARARVAQKGYDQALALCQDGKVNSEDVLLWSKRLMESQIATAKGSYVNDAESRTIHVTAAKAHRDRMRHFEEVVRALVEKGESSQLSISTAEYLHIEAEALVLEYSLVKAESVDSPEQQSKSR